jgi:hypothetical protein
MSAVPTRLINDSFLQKISTPDGNAKVAEATGTVIRDRLREVSVFRKLMPPENVTRADCQISTKHDTLTKMVHLEPKSRAMTMAFDGNPKVTIIRAPRVECGFYMISSEEYQKTTQELMVYDIPVTQMIEENIGNDMQEIEDRQQLLHAFAAVWAMQKEANGGVEREMSSTTLAPGAANRPREVHVMKSAAAAADPNQTSELHPFRRSDITKLIRSVANRRLKLSQLVWPEPDWCDVLDWTLNEQGDKMQSESLVDGYKYNLLLGFNIIRTIKTDIFRPGRVWGFPAANFLGKNYVLNAPQFYIDKVRNRITFSAWEDVGSIFVNLAGIVCVESFSSDSNPATDIHGLLAESRPLAEEALGAVNNMVEAGIRFPAIQSY